MSFSLINFSSFGFLGQGDIALGNLGLKKSIKGILAFKIVFSSPF